MAVSIAVNWTPPVSSPLFEDEPSSGSPPETKAQGPSSPLPSSSSKPSSPSASTIRPTAGTSRNYSSASSPSREGAPSSPQGMSQIIGPASSPPRPSYAAAATSSRGSPSSPSPSPADGRPSTIRRTSSAHSSSYQHQQAPYQQQLQYGQQWSGQAPVPPMPSHQAGFAAGGQRPSGSLGANASMQSQHTGPGFGSAYNMAYAPPTTMPNQYAWAQYQQMLAAQQQQHQQLHSSASVGDLSQGDPRLRAQSSPQRPNSLMYNDSFANAQGYPGGPSYQPGRSNLPPGAMAPPSSSPAGMPSSASSPAFHPYRRQPRPSDGQQQQAQAPLAPFGSGPSQGIPASASSHQLAPPAQLRSRSSSSDSRDQQRLAAAPGQSYATASNNSHTGSAVSSASGTPEGSVPPTQPTFNIKRPEPPPRTESTRSTSSGVGRSESDASAPHSRSESVSSHNSAHSAAAGSDRASTVGGRSTPTPAFKKPSPLSRRPEDDDDRTVAAYPGSDQDDLATVNGRATPTPAVEAQKKKGFGGKLRKALSLSPMNEIQQPNETAPAAGLSSARRPTGAPSGRTMPTGSVGGRGNENFNASSSMANRPPPSPTRSTMSGISEFGGPPVPSHLAGSSAASISSKRSGRPPISGSTDGSGKRSLFNRKFNSSTDNISISSTVSSASVMLRKVGNLGKMARRHSLMGLTNMFNKDKEGAEGIQGDDFGVASGGGASTTDDSTLGNKSKKGSKKGFKAQPLPASVSHATVELEHSNSGGGDGSMTPAAHYVRQHQLQMKQQAEAEAQAAREREAAEAAAAAAASAAAAERAAKAKVGTGKTTDEVIESRQKMIEKEKERLKSKRGWRNRLRVGGSSVDQTGSAPPTGLETVPYQPQQHDGGAESDVDYASITAPRGVYAGSTHEGVAGLPPSADYSSGVGVYDNDDDLVPPQMPAAGGNDGGESTDGETDSLRHWGEGIERSRASAALVKAPKSILKKSASSSQLDQVYGGRGDVYNNGSAGLGHMNASFDRPFAGRIRANSYDAPQGNAAPGAPMLSSMSTTTEGTDRMDGVARPSQDDRRPGSSGSARGGDGSAFGSQGPRPSGPSFGHHSNSSMPTLSMMTNPTTGASGSLTRSSMQKKRICFTEEHIYHSTWPAHVYDRRGELATCNRLTPLLAQRIKEELNSFKMEEMEVAPSSRIYTHFFV